MSNILDIAIVADDLTGAADAGVQFCPHLGPVYMADGKQIVLEPVDIQSRGITVFTHTRSVLPADAADTVYQVTRAIQKLAPAVVYKKIDSCLRGNLGAELDAMLSALHATVSFVAPALPEQGRTTINDCHRINGIPVSETEIGRDPLCPIKESRLSVLLATQSQMSIGHIPLQYLEKGTDVLFQQVNKLLAKGCRHIVFDAQETNHLDTIATLSHSRFEDVLLAGSAGLARSLARVISPTPVSETTVHRPQLKKWLFVCGSASRVLAEQASALAQFAGWPQVTINPERLIAAHTSEQRRSLLTELETAWATGSLIISITPRRKTQTIKKPDQIIGGLAEVVSSLLSLSAPDGLFLSGGDTAEKMLHDINGSAILQEEILPGVMHGEIAGGPLKGLPVFTKPGSFGQPDTLIKLLRSLTGTPSQKP